MWGHGSGEGGTVTLRGLMGTPSVWTGCLCYVGMSLDGLREKGHSKRTI